MCLFWNVGLIRVTKHLSAMLLVCWILFLLFDTLYSFSCTILCLWPPYVIGQAICVFILWFLLLSFFFFQLAKKSPKSRHLSTIPQLCWAMSSQLRHISTIGKKVVKQPYLLNMSPQYGELGPRAAEVVSLVWGTPSYFNGFRVLAALLHGILVVGVSQTLQHWTEGATYIRQGGHHVGHWPTFLVCNETVIKDPTTLYTCSYTTLWNIGTLLTDSVQCPVCFAPPCV